MRPLFATDEDVMTAFTYLVGRVIESLDNIPVRGEIEYINGEDLNCSPELHIILKDFSLKLIEHTQGSGEGDPRFRPTPHDGGDDFLILVGEEG
ncbi:hypothetical protein LXL04_016573 [Taraxacum kok-saghyz]